MNINEKSIQAFRRLAAGVSVISAGNAEHRFAMTASSVTSVSMEPPALLVCINDDAEINPLINTENAKFCVNILKQSEEDISNICATPGLAEERFATGNWQKNENLVPFLKDTQANIFCKVAQQHRYATHTIYIATIEDVLFSEPVDPLLYLNSAYGNFKSK